jgi:hypothetical protein
LGVGYHRKLLKDGFVIIPNHKLLEEFTKEMTHSHLKELRNKIMDKSLKMSERRQALYFFKFSSPIYEWKYYKRWYKVSY